MPFERRKFGGRREGGSGGFGGRGGSGGFGGRSGGFGGRGGSGGGWGERRGSFGGDRGEPKPVKEGEEYDVEISEVSQRGDGIARVKNFVIFVAGAKQGEKVHIKVTEVRGRHAVGEVVGAGGSTEGAAEEETPAEEAEESEAEGAEGAAAGSENKEDEGF